MIIPTLRISEKKDYDKMLEEFLKRDIRLLRVNFTRYPLTRYIEDVLYIKQQVGRRIDIMADLPIPGRKYRTLIPSGEMLINQGEKITFVPFSHQCGDKMISVDTNFFVETKDTLRILIGDGELTFTTLRVEKDKIVAEAENTGKIREGRAFILTGKMPYKKYDTDMMQKYLECMQTISPQKLVLSFAEDNNVLLEMAEKFRKVIPEAEIVPKIETQVGIDNCEVIMKSFKTVMLGRGDLGLFSDIKAFGSNQNYVLDRGLLNDVNVIVATDILTSLYESTVPARGELTDIYYLKEKKVKDIVVSAGISLCPKLFVRFMDIVGDDFG